MKSLRHRHAVAATAATACAALALSLAPAALADNGTDTSALRAATSAENALQHLEALQAIADANGGTRSAGTPGHVASAEYIEAQLQGAGYKTWRQPFSYEKAVVHSSSLAQTAPTPTAYVDGTDYLTMSFTGSGDVTAAVQAVDINLAGDRASTSGCEAADFAGFTAGNIALIQRGTCTFGQKVANAEAAGAAGVIIFNQGNGGADRTDLFGGTLGALAGIPAVSVSFPLGASLANTANLQMRLQVDAEVLRIETFNVLTDTAGRADRTVVVGAHLDSVTEGPGINDNGSGSAAILEIALQMAAQGVTPENRVRFAWWSGEEDGLIGSDHYASLLTARDIKEHAANLNFDMVASPNPVRFVYDGDGKDLGTAGPNGSGLIEKVFLDYFASQGLATAPTEFDGRSDYSGFITNGIPAGGLFTGAEGIKTAEEAAIFGGTAGVAYDPCYHAACDDISNLDMTVFEEMLDAAAHATLTFAETTSAVNGTAKGKGSGAPALDFKANELQR